jgi:hypothetical protein
MEIWATGDSFSFAMGGISDYKYASNKDGSISLVAGKTNYPISVTTHRGIFLELVNEAGEDARAAIEAMRTPTDAMINAFYRCNAAESGNGMWQVMIDAALTSRPKAGS